MTTQPMDVPAPAEATEHCGCDCARWAHQLWGVCLGDVPTGRLTLMYFDDDMNPVAPFPRRVCAPCKEHIVSARSRGGERMNTSGEVSP
jgi:hypothetical protein